MAKKRRSIGDFMRDKRKTKCKVCNVAPRIRKLMNQARGKSRVSIPILLEWLQQEYSVKLTASELRHHYSGLHEGPSGYRTAQRGNQ